MNSIGNYTRSSFGNSLRCAYGKSSRSSAGNSPEVSSKTPPEDREYLTPGASYSNRSRNFPKILLGICKPMGIISVNKDAQIQRVVAHQVRKYLRQIKWTSFTDYYCKSAQIAPYFRYHFRIGTTWRSLGKNKSLFACYYHPPPPPHMTFRSQADRFLYLPNGERRWLKKILLGRCCLVSSFFCHASAPTTSQPYAYAPYIELRSRCLRTYTDDGAFLRSQYINWLMALALVLVEGKKKLYRRVTGVAAERAPLGRIMTYASSRCSRG